MDRRYKGWTIEENPGRGWILTRGEQHNGKTIKRYAVSVNRAKIVIDDIELRIKVGLNVNNREP